MCCPINYACSLLQIELTLSVEATLPTKLRRKFIIGQELLFPNEDLSLWEKIEKAVWGTDRFPTGGVIANAVKKEDSVSLLWYVPMHCENEVQ